jgi:hypothetical protein
MVRYVVWYHPTNLTNPARRRYLLNGTPEYVYGIEIAFWLSRLPNKLNGQTWQILPLENGRIPEPVVNNNLKRPDFPQFIFITDEVFLPLYRNVPEPYQTVPYFLLFQRHEEEVTHNMIVPLHDRQQMLGILRGLQILGMEPQSYDMTLTDSSEVLFSTLE